MKKSFGIAFGLVAFCGLAGTAIAAEATSSQAQASARPAESLPMVPQARPGVFAVKKKGPNRFSLSVTGHQFTARSDIEKYLAYRAAELTSEQKGSWFTFAEARTKDSKLPASKRDPAGLRYSFRMDYWRPAWRYKLAGEASWKAWSPFSGEAFFADGKDAKTITDFEVTADITVRTGQMDDADPLAFEAGAVSDLLINQVSPPA